MTSTDATLGSRVISKQELDEAAVKNTIGRINTAIRGESPYISSWNLLITEDTPKLLEVTNIWSGRETACSGNLIQPLDVI